MAIDLIWTLGIYLVIFAILWGIITQVEARVPAVTPFMWLMWVVFYVAAGVIAINILLGNVPLIPFGQVGRARLG
jgi:hypothetical protein